MEYKNPNLVMNKTEIFLNLHFGLDFMTDSEAADELKKHFFTQECVHPNTELMHFYLQNIADESKDFLNKVYALSLVEYNPIDNYDRYEEWTDESEGNSKVNSNSQNKVYEYPMNTTDEKAVNRGDSSGESSSDMTGTSRHTGHLRGNIGVTTAAQMLQGEIDLAEKLKKLKKIFCDQFDDLFMITI